MVLENAVTRFLPVSAEERIVSRRIPSWSRHLILIVRRPEGNDDYVRTAPDNPKKVGACMCDPRSAVLI